MSRAATFTAMTNLSNFRWTVKFSQWSSITPSHFWNLRNFKDKHNWRCFEYLPPFPLWNVFFMEEKLSYAILRWLFYQIIPFLLVFFFAKLHPSVYFIPNYIPVFILYLIKPQLLCFSYVNHDFQVPQNPNPSKLQISLLHELDIWFLPKLQPKWAIKGSLTL